MSSGVSTPKSPSFSPSPSPKPTLKKSTPKKRSSNSATPSPHKRGKTGDQRVKGLDGDNGGRKTGSWTKREVRQLFDAVVVTPSSVSWNQVADKVEGRDKLSCSNKWRYDLLPKIQAYIDSLGE